MWPIVAPYPCLTKTSTTMSWYANATPFNIMITFYFFFKKLLAGLLPEVGWVGYNGPILDLIATGGEPHSPSTMWGPQLSFARNPIFSRYSNFSDFVFFLHLLVMNQIRFPLDILSGKYTFIFMKLFLWNSNVKNTFWANSKIQNSSK